MLNETMKELIVLGVDHYNKVPVANFSNKDRNDAIRAKFYEIMGTEGFDVMRYEAHKHEIFEVIREIASQTITNDTEAMSVFYNYFVDESQVKDADKKKFYIPNDAYLTVGKVSGNNWDLDRQRKDAGSEFTIETDAYYIKIYEYWRRFMTERMDFSDLIIEVDRSIKKFKDMFVADVFIGGVAGIPVSDSNYAYSGSYNEAKIQNVLDHVSGANSDSQIVLSGTKSALNKLQGISIPNLSDAQKAEYGAKGFLREWKGYICAELPTVLKPNSITDFAFDNNKIYVLPVGAKPIKIVIEGEPIVAETDTVANTKDMTKEFATIFRLGGAFVLNKLFGYVEISS